MPESVLLTLLLLVALMAVPATHEDFCECPECRQHRRDGVLKYV